MPSQPRSAELLRSLAELSKYSSCLVKISLKKTNIFLSTVFGEYGVRLHCCKDGLNPLFPRLSINSRIQQSHTYIYIYIYIYAPVVSSVNSVHTLNASFVCMSSSELNRKCLVFLLVSNTHTHTHTHTHTVLVYCVELVRGCVWCERT